MLTWGSVVTTVLSCAHFILCYQHFVAYETVDNGSRPLTSHEGAVSFVSFAQHVGEYSHYHQHQHHPHHHRHQRRKKSKLRAIVDYDQPAMLNPMVKYHWPVKKEAVMDGDVILGGLMMVHSRDDVDDCGPIMPQGGIQALETMLYTLDRIHEARILPNFKIGAHILDDCDKDTYGLEMAVDFIKGSRMFSTHD
jgi:Receptor family ligand binding region